MPAIDRIPRTPTRLRRTMAGIGSDFVPYTGAIADVDLGAFNFATTGTITSARLIIDNVNNYIYLNGSLLTIVSQSHLVLDPYSNKVDLLDNELETSGVIDCGSLEVGTTSGGAVTDIKDEDDMASNSQTALATQQSIKAYIGNTLSTGYVPYTGANANVDLGVYNLVTSGYGDFASIYIGGVSFLRAPNATSVCLGPTAGDSIEAGGTDNTCIGNAAGTAITTGDYNSAIGSEALYSNTTGHRNTAVGYGALYSNTVGFRNSAVGSQALNKNTTGHYNSAVGHAALLSNTEGDRNSAVGQTALRSNTTGHYNSAIGSQALYSNTTGEYNSAVGFQALYLNITGHDNNAMGSLTLYANTTGFYNNAMGSNALHSNTTGDRNNAVGRAALYFNTIGHNNSAIGQTALYSNTTGDGNDAVGSNALYNNTTGDDNTAIGTDAFFNLKPTSRAITAFADNGDGKTKVTSASVHGIDNGTVVEIYGTTSYNGSWTIEQITADTFVMDETFVADDATGWWDIASEGRRNIAIGIFAGYRQTTISDSLFIDNQLRANAAVELTDSIIYGVMAAAPADQDLYLNADVYLKADDRKLFFGATDDVSLYFDGSDLEINLTETGSNNLNIGDGGTTDYLSISATGAVLFKGAAGLAYGEISCYNEDDTITITGLGIANKVQITSFDTNGPSLNTIPDHTNDHITITRAGHYLCTVSLHIESTGPGGGADEFGFGVHKNDGGVLFENCHGHRKLAGGGGDVGAITMSGILDLAVDDTIELWCWNENSTDNLIVDDATLTLVQIGGT